MMRFFTIVASVCLYSASLALANGGFKPLIEYLEPPGIPVQRALITYRDGMETLIVESTYQTASPEVAWILPLPAEPTKLEKADPGLLETLSIQVQPRVITSSGLAWIIIVGMILLAFPLVGIRLMAGEPLSIYAVIAIALIAWFCGAICLMPSLDRARAGGGPEEEASGVNILNAQRVGNYDVQVLRADSSGALADFLAAGKLQPLSTEEKKVFDQYIAEGWCFLLSTLHRTPTNEPATPHPISATFPAKSIVFPMRATRFANTKTHVELFVATDTRTTADGFTTVAAGRLTTSTGNPRSPTYQDGFFASNRHTIFASHPDLKDRLWDRCVLTKLTADLSPAQMQNDVTIERVGYVQPYVHEVDSNSVRSDWIGAVLSVAATAVLVWLAMARVHLSTSSRRRRYWEFALSGGAVALAVLGIYLFFPSIHTVQHYSPRLGYRGLVPLHAAIGDAIMQHVIDASLADAPERLPEILKDRVRDVTLRNPFTGDLIAPRRSPGNYEVLRQDGQVKLVLYDGATTAREIKLPAPPTTAPATSPTASLGAR